MTRIVLDVVKTGVLAHAMHARHQESAQAPTPDTHQTRQDEAPVREQIGLPGESACHAAQQDVGAGSDEVVEFF